MLNTFLQTAALDGDSLEALQNVTITGLLIVFSVLILLTVIFRLFGAIADGLANKPKKVKKPEVKAELPVFDDEDEDLSVYMNQGPAQGNQLIAVIAAAIAAYEPDKKYVVRSVKRAGTAAGGRNAWNAAGAYENTRPF